MQGPRWKRRTLGLTAAAAALWLATPAAGGVYGDFNGDGFADLAVGARQETVGGFASAGAVNVLYGSPNGLTSAGDQYWNQDSPGVPDSSETGDRFGAALAAGDFDADGFADLAIGAPNEELSAASEAGSVTVLYGSSTGLADDGAQFWSQGDPFLAGDGIEDNDQFGSSLAAANFGKGAAADLAIGVVAEDIGATNGAGAVNVLYGSSGGLTTTGSQFWHQSSPGVAGDGAEAGDFFGESLAAANFGKGSQADLAVGAVDEDVGATSNAGAVNVLYGSSGGLTASGDQFWHQGRAGLVGDGAEAEDGFGSALAAANFGRGSAADLAVGAFNEDAGVVADAGAVNVLYGSSAGLNTTGDQFWHQNRSGVLDAAEMEDAFGDSLAAANLGKGPAADLVVGVPLEDIGAISDAGAVNVLYGSSGGLTANGDQFWHQDVSGVADAAEASDFFGSSLAAANFGKGSAVDLAVGAPTEDISINSDVGAVNALYGSSTGLRVAGDQFWHRDRAGVAGGGASPGARFGNALAPRR